jgi:YjbE family integral membrane protein
MDVLGSPLLKIIEIVWVNIVLSGDNAVVIAMACRGLPADKRRLGLLLGAGVAVLLRVVFTVVIATLLATPFLKIAGSLLLFWIAVQLVTEDDGEERAIRQTDRLWRAVRTVAVADAVMSLDNVLAIAAIAKDSTALLILGLAISIPLIVAGAGLIMALLDRFPIFVWAGAALLGWIAGDMLVSDPWLVGRLGEDLSQRLEIPAAVVGAALVLAAGYLLKQRASRPER